MNRINAWHVCATSALALAQQAAAGVAGSASGFLQTNQTITPVTQWTSSISIDQCTTGSAETPFFNGHLTAHSEIAGMTGDFLVEAELDALDSPTDLVAWAAADWPGLAPPFSAGPCPLRPMTAYGRLSGRVHLQSIESGPGDPIHSRQAQLRMTFQDTLEIIADADGFIALPVSIRGSVNAAEPFGFPFTTQGHARLSVSGTLGGATIDHVAEIFSSGAMPTVVPIDQSQLVPVALKKGTNIVEVDIVGAVLVETAAQGTSSQVGLAQAGAIFPDAITIGRFVAGDGGKLPQGLIIRSAVSGMVYEDTTGAKPIPGDLNGDGVVNTLDLGILLSSWSIPSSAPGCGGALPCAADINGDGVVNTLDLGILLSSWTL